MKGRGAVKPSVGSYLLPQQIELLEDRLLLTDVLVGSGMTHGTPDAFIDESIDTYTQQAGGTLQIEIGGLTAGTEYDQVNVSGLATLDGTLDIQLLDGFVPDEGDTFDIL